MTMLEKDSLVAVSSFILPKIQHFHPRTKLLQAMFAVMAPLVVNYISRVKWLNDSVFETLA